MVRVQPLRSTLPERHKYRLHQEVLTEVKNHDSMLATLAYLHGSRAAQAAGGIPGGAASSDLALLKALGQELRGTGESSPQNVCGGRTGAARTWAPRGPAAASRSPARGLRRCQDGPGRESAGRDGSTAALRARRRRPGSDKRRRRRRAPRGARAPGTAPRPLPAAPGRDTAANGRTGPARGRPAGVPRGLGRGQSGGGRPGGPTGLPGGGRGRGGRAARRAAGPRSPGAGGCPRCPLPPLAAPRRLPARRGGRGPARRGCSWAQGGDGGG
ncbi:translation initiation factor IF-2-like [Cygnus atratus]|uniref:translation initiation factor IF-2-like n=1 Tax=Cygnus atratus TaxID=8868 RepID=UPI0021B74C37|nr:translation initiation factor IF-2-like [Cygnus atratus]